MTRDESETHNGTRLWNLRDTGYSVMKSKNRQKTTYGYYHDDQDAFLVLDTLVAIVGVWQALKSPSFGISTRKYGKLEVS